MEVNNGKKHRKIKGLRRESRINTRNIRTHRKPSENDSKIGKKRELGENGENWGENSPPVWTGFSGFLKIFRENYSTNLLLLTRILRRGAWNDYREILQGDSGAISRIHNQRPDVPHLPYQ